MSERDNRIRPNTTHVVGMEQGGKLYFNGCFDVLMYFAPLDIHWVRYFDEDDDENPIKLVALQPENAQMLLDETDLPYVIRDTIFEREHEILVGVLGKWASDAMFGLDIDVAAIEAEEQKRE